MDNLDFTSENRPFVFWVNNDVDRGHLVDYDLVNDTWDYEEDDLAEEDGVPDCQFRDELWRPAIPSDRDLEDYARICLPGISNLISTLPSGYSVELNWRNQDSPGINLFRALDSDGGTGYLTNEITGNSQLTYYVGSVSSFQKTSLSQKFAELQPYPLNDFYIFCGSARGKGELLLQVKDQNGTVICETSAFIELKDVKEMYERWTVGENGDVSPANNASIATDLLPRGVSPYRFNYDQSDQTNTPYILHVHGWNMETWEKDRYAETAFKRLYWQGYQGRFGEFRWPTDNGFDDLWDVITDSDNYDRSEFQAWKSGTPLRQLLTDLDGRYPDDVYLTAHSMGNIVAGQALRVSSANPPLVQTYVAMQGAVPSHAYDSGAPSRSLGVNDSSTPNRYSHYWNTNSAPYFDGVGGAGRYINFFNESDFALGFWEVDQNLKPRGDYSYAPCCGSDSGGGAFLRNSTELIFPGDTFELFAFSVEARCHALGAQNGIAGAFATTAEINLNAAPFNFGAAHKGHSMEFRSTNMKQAIFWNTLLDQMGLLPQ